MNGKNLNPKLIQLRRLSRERYLELAGIDPKKVLQIEQEIDGQYEELASGVRDMLKKEGKEMAEQQKIGLKLAQRRRLHMAVAKTVWPPWWNPCTATARFFSHGEPMTDPGTVSYEEAGNIAHLLADTVPADSPKEIEAEFRFILDLPDVLGPAQRYCVCPVIQMNGHWLAWAWSGGSCGGVTTVGSAMASLTLKVQVYQGAELKGEREHPILYEPVSGSMDHQSGFYYDAEVHGGVQLNVELEAATDATVLVKCIAKVEAVNHGRAWVDMLTSPYFYFKVPEVHWGLSPWQLMRAELVEPFLGKYREYRERMW